MISSPTTYVIEHTRDKQYLPPCISCTIVHLHVLIYVIRYYTHVSLYVIGKVHPWIPNFAMALELLTLNL